MMPLVEFPELVQHYAHFFRDVFSAEAFVEFERYISGLIVSENKTVEGINRLFVVESRNQSSLNRLLTASPFSLEDLNTARMELLASVTGTKMKAKGVLGLDDTLLIHYGKDFEKIAILWDHVSGTYVPAHDLVTVHYSDDETDYPVMFQLWEPVDLEKLEAGLRAAGIALKASKEPWKTSDPQKWRGYILGVWRRKQASHPVLAELYDSKLIMAEKLLQTWVKDHPGEEHPVTFDSWFTQPAFCRFLDQELKLPYVGTLDDDDRIDLQSGASTLREFADHLKIEHQQALQSQQPGVFHKTGIAYKGKQETYYSYCDTHTLHNFGKQRLVINYRQADLSDNPTYFISNRLYWHAGGITRIRRHRWPVEVYHQEGKDEGLDQYQLRNFSAIQRHVALVAVVYSMLRAAQQDPELLEKLQCQLRIKFEATTPAFLRRASQAQALWCLALSISAGLTKGQSLPQILAPLIQAICHT